MGFDSLFLTDKNTQYIFISVTELIVGFYRSINTFRIRIFLIFCQQELTLLTWWLKRRDKKSFPHNTVATLSKKLYVPSEYKDTGIFLAIVLRWDGKFSLLVTKNMERSEDIIISYRFFKKCSRTPLYRLLCSLYVRFSVLFLESFSLKSKKYIIWTCWC